LTERQWRFGIFHLAYGQKKPRLAAGKARFLGDLKKRADNMLDLPDMQKFLAEFAPPPNTHKVEANPKSITKRLEQMASGEGLDKTAVVEQRAIELLGRSLGMWDSKGQAGKDRLHELMAVLKAGPVREEDIRCECGAFNRPMSKYCNECGHKLIPDPPKKPDPLPEIIKSKRKQKESVQ